MEVDLPLVVLYLWCSLSLSLGTEIDLTIDIAPGKQECFWQNVAAETDGEVDYQVIDGGDMDIDFAIMAPDNRFIHADQRKTENVAKFRATVPGDYKFCFDNTFSRLSSKIVYFEIFLNDEKEDEDDIDDDAFTFEGEGFAGQLDMTVKDFLGILERSKVNLEKSIQVQTLIRIHEAKDRNTQESNFFRVNFFSVLQLSVMVCVALVQVIMIRSLFQDRKGASGAGLRQKT